MSRTIGTRSTVHRDRRLTLLAIVILSSVSACGRYLPSHIHDPGAEKTASDLQSNISEYQINQSGLYDNLAVNLERFRVEEDELINMMAANYANALVTKAPDFTWREIKDNLTELKMRETALRNEIIKKLNADLVQRGVATAELKDANQAIGKLKNEIAKEKARTKAWEKAAERFREAISKLPASLSELSNKAAGLSALLTSVEGLDAASLDGILASADEAKKIIDGIKKTSKSLRDDLAADLEDAPGITVLILDLGLELAEMNKRRAKAKFAALSARREVFEESLVHADIAAQFVRIAQSKITSDDFDRTLRLEIEIDRESMIARDDVTIATDAVFFKLLVLRLYVSATWLVEYQKAVLPVRLGQIAHSESIAESRVNDEAWQAMIKSGIDALVEYHKGGLKKEDLANFLRLAQTVALFFIAE